MNLPDLPTIDAVQAAALPDTGPCRDTVAFTLFLSLIAPSERKSQFAAALADQFVHALEMSDADLTRAKYDALALRDKFASEVSHV
tara:strand:+ start:1092 stop:1349 length:258 start_codon:yes stop_codon:yes gene_type:complete